MNEKTRKKIESYLYDFNNIDDKINTIISSIREEEYNQGYTKYIKHKSSSLENQVIRNIGLEQRALKIRKWQKLINNILKEYRYKNNLKYSFIILKYFNKENSIMIENRLNLGFKEQEDINQEILNYIFLVTIKNNILVKEV